MVAKERGGSAVESTERVTVVEAPTAIPEAGTERLYHVGIVADENTPDGEAPRPAAPRFSVHVAGICFPFMTEMVKLDANNKTIRIPRVGDYLKLTDEKVAEIKVALAKKVVRWESREQHRGYLLNTDKTINGRGAYRPMPGDVPLAKYLYLEPVARERATEFGQPME